MATKHHCLRDELEWEEKPRFDSESISYVGKCPTCGKVFEQVFSENEGLYDAEFATYIYGEELS